MRVATRENFLPAGALVAQQRAFGERPSVLSNANPAKSRNVSASGATNQSRRQVDGSAPALPVPAVGGTSCQSTLAASAEYLARPSLSSVVIRRICASASAAGRPRRTPPAGIAVGIAVSKEDSTVGMLFAAIVAQMASPNIGAQTAAR